MNSTVKAHTMPQSLMLVGRRWFERTNGNTYHSVSIYVDGKPVHKVDCEYGYGNQWEWTGMRWLIENGYLQELERYGNGGHESLWGYCEKHGIAYSAEVADVQRKKDL